MAIGYRRSGVPLEDLIQEGNLGLIEAVERFDPECSHRFCSYTVWRIRKAIQMAVAASALAEYVADESVPNVSDTVVRRMELDRIKEIEAAMSQRARHVIVRRYWPRRARAVRARGTRRRAGHLQARDQPATAQIRGAA